MEIIKTYNAESFGQMKPLLNLFNFKVSKRLLRLKIRQPVVKFYENSESVIFFVKKRFFNTFWGYIEINEIILFKGSPKT